MPHITESTDAAQSLDVQSACVCVRHEDLDIQDILNSFPDSPLRPNIVHRVPEKVHLLTCCRLQRDTYPVADLTSWVHTRRVEKRRPWRVAGNAPPQDFCALNTRRVTCEPCLRPGNVIACLCRDVMNFAAGNPSTTRLLIRPFPRRASDDDVFLGTRHNRPHRRGRGAEYLAT